jgi:hypothetical protein
VEIGCCKMGGLQHDRTIGALFPKYFENVYHIGNQALNVI